MISWSLTFISIHSLACYGFAVLYNWTPDKLQRAIVGVFMVSQWLLIVAYSYSIAADPSWMSWKELAQELEHIAVLLYVFRLFFVEHICKRSSPASRSFLES